MPERIVVLGLAPNASSQCGGTTGAGGFEGATRQVVERADLVVGAERHLSAAGLTGGATLRLTGDLDAAFEAIDAEQGVVCVLASGDPGFFGIVRPLAERFGPGILDVRPAPSSVALAFAALGLPWDDARVVSAHGRPLEIATQAAMHHPKVALLMSPANPPEALGRALLDAGAEERRVFVCARLGAADESIEETNLDGLAAGRWESFSVVVLISGDGVACAPTLAWGLDDSAFEHRMITASEVRGIALGKLALPGTGVVWDVGAGSGSVAIECARVCPRLRVIAVERRADDVRRISANATAHGVAVEVVEGEAPAALAGLPDPDRAFVGGGGVAVLDTVLLRLRQGGKVVATYAALDRALAAADRLGSLVQVAVSTGTRLPDRSLRLEARNPVFMAWGPEESRG